MASGGQKLFRGAEYNWEESWSPSEPEVTATLWRYMSFAKFCSLLNRSALFFSLVGEMEDRYEGFIYPPIPREEKDRLQQAELFGREMLRKMARAALISCWTESDHESSLMWKYYAGVEGVAVRTSYKNLRDSICSVAEPPLPIVFGQVEYADYHQREVPRFGWAPLFHKRMEYRAESEVRAVLPGPPIERWIEQWDLETRPEVPEIPLDEDVNEQRGRYVPVNLEILVKEIVLPPHVSPWFAQVVESALKGSPVRSCVTRSALESPPIGAKR